MMVNGIALDAKEISYVNHQILIGRGLMRERNKNQIEVIF